MLIFCSWVQALCAGTIQLHAADLKFKVSHCCLFLMLLASLMLQASLVLLASLLLPPLLLVLQHAHAVSRFPMLLLTTSLMFASSVNALLTSRQQNCMHILPTENISHLQTYGLPNVCCPMTLNAAIWRVAFWKKNWMSPLIQIQIQRAFRFWVRSPYKNHEINWDNKILKNDCM